MTNWWVYDAPEGEHGDINSQLEENSFYFCSLPAPKKIWLAKIDNEEWDLQDNFPTKWIFEPFKIEKV